MGQYTVVDDPRGIGGSRALANRITTPAPPPPPQTYPPFSLDVLGFGGQNSIPEALAYALKWQIEFLSLPDPPNERKQELADNLIRLWQYLVAQEFTSPRDADGTLLREDFVKSMGHVKGKVASAEVAYNQFVPVAEFESDPLDPWKPKLFPRELPPVQRQLYPERPRKLDEIPPFFPDMVKRWVLARAYKAPPAAATPVAGVKPRSPYAMTVLNDVQPPGPPDKEAVQAAVDQAEREMLRQAVIAKRLDIGAAQYAGAVGPKPTIAKAIATLKKISLKDIEQQTSVDFHDADPTRPLFAGTELILYHSVFSFLIDKEGEPWTINGRFDYPIMVPEPGSQMKRHCPPPGGVYVSVQKYGFQNYRVENGRIDKVLDGGVGGFEEYGYGYSGPHVFHQKIQAWLDGIGSHVYIAGVTVPAANNRIEITVSRIASRVPEFAEACVPPLVLEVKKRAKDKIEHWQDFLEQIAYEVIKEIIIDEVKDRVRKYIIKKVGVRIVPGLNAAAAIYDLATGGKDRMQMRNAIACLLVALESNSDEDMTIAAKVCSKIIADAFEDKIMAAIVKMGKAAAKKAGKHVAMKVKGGSGDPASDALDALEEGADKNAKPAADGANDAAKPKTPANAAPNKPAQPAAVPLTPANAPVAKGASGATTPNASLVPPSTKGGQPDDLSLGAGGPNQKAPTDKPAPKNADEASDKAVEDMKRKIYDDLQQKAADAVNQSNANAQPTSADAAAKNKAGRKAAAGTTDEGTGDDGAEETGTARASGSSGVTPDSRGTGAKISASSASGASGSSGSAAATGGSGSGSGSGGGGGSGGGTGGRNNGGSGRGGRRRRKYPQPPQGGPPPPDAGTPGEPQPSKAKPDPVLPNVGIKDDNSVLEDDGFQAVNTTLKPRLKSRKDAEMLRANRERIGDPIQPEDDPHHTLHKKGGGETGARARESASNSGVSVNTPEAGLAARGTGRAAQATDDRGVRPTQDTIADHTRQHGEKKLTALEKRLNTVEGDDDAARGILRDHTNILADGRQPEDPEFHLDSRSDSDMGDNKASPSGIITDEIRQQRADAAKRRSDSAKKGAETRRRNAEEKARKKREDDDDGGDKK